MANPQPYPETPRESVHRVDGNSGVSRVCVCEGCELSWLISLPTTTPTHYDVLGLVL
jgi:hypothetical protein